MYDRRGFGVSIGSDVLDFLKREAQQWIQDNVSVELTPEARQQLVEQYVRDRMGAIRQQAPSIAPWLVLGGAALVGFLLSRRA